MYPGYLLLGAGPFETGTNYEIVNNARAYAYAYQAGICWLHDCTDCPAVGLVVPGGPVFVSPKDDPAPWYDPDNMDTWGFLGLIGLEVAGAEDSTRKTPVTSALTGGGVIGRSYWGPRTIVVRALAIAIDECSLQAGLEWFQFQTERKKDPCHGDTFTFFDCCPCMCAEDEPQGPCWALIYRELKRGPYCTQPEGDPAYLDTSGALVHSPGVRAFTPFITWLINIRGPADTFGGVIASRYEAGVGGWILQRHSNVDNVPGGLRMAWSPDDITWTEVVLNTEQVTGDFEWLAITANRDDGIGNSIWTTSTSVDGLNWTAADTVTHPVAHDPALGAFTDGEVSSTGAPARLNEPVVDGTADLSYYGLWDGPFPTTGQILYAFDPTTDYDFDAQIPPTTWTGSYGNPWTITNPAALTAPTEGEAGAWWPDTYLELKTGPPLPDEDWCDWIDIYFELKNGLAGWSCCADMCVVPYYRQFHNARITEGPVVLRHPAMNSQGAMMEVEFTLVAADPQQYGLPAATTRTMIESGTPFSDPAPSVAAPDPFALAGA